ncbi:MAG TPA: hypothetical protein VNK82_04530 [Terriglobales bacterium]|nr:hypothetical protein [Terriglobales bacterium]
MPSPFRVGLRTATRDPGLVLAEITWRWAFGAGALAILGAGAARFLATLNVSDSNLTLLRTRIPSLMAEALAEILRGAGGTLLAILAVVLPAVAVLWVAAATVGRVVTLRVVVPREGRINVGAVAGINFLRAALALATLLAFAGATIVAGLAATSGEENSPGLFMLVTLILWLVVSMLSGTLNWYLSVAPLLAVREGLDTLGAVAETVRFVRSHARQFSGVSTAFGLLRLFFLGATIVLSLIPLALMGTAPGWLVTALLVLITLGYFAVADFLYSARLAAYARIGEESAQPSANSAQLSGEAVAATSPAPAMPTAPDGAASPSEAAPAPPVA